MTEPALQTDKQTDKHVDIFNPFDGIPIQPNIQLLNFYHSVKCRTYGKKMPQCRLCIPGQLNDSAVKHL